MRAPLAPFLALAVSLGCADAQAPAPAPPVSLVDGRDLATDPTTDDTDRPAVRLAIRAATAYWRDRDPAQEAEPRVLAAASGVFTEAGAAQDAVLYLVSLWPRCCPKVGLAVLDGDRVVRNVTFESPTQGLRAAPDLDGDGLDEVVLTSTFGMGGSWETSATVLSLGPEGPRSHGSTALFTSDCGTGRPGATEAAVRVLATPGPAFSAERYTKTCDVAVWTAEGEAAPLTLDPPPPEAGYVDLGAD